MAIEKVNFPMAGKVVDVHVQPGDKVEEDQPLATFESMKIEMPLNAPCAGTVKEVLVEAGYQPECAYLEVCHELKLIVDMIHTEGITGMLKRVSDTAEYGSMTRGRRIITEDTKDEMFAILDEIQTGQFATEWILENQAGRPSFKALERIEAEHPMEEVGKRIRSMMPWLKE